MANVMTNNYFGWFAGPDSSFTATEWASGPSLASLQALKNLSPTVKVDGTDFNLQASDQVEDRSFADAAGAKARGPLQASGNVEIYTPGPSDTTSINAQGWNTFATPRTALAVVQRPVKSQSQAIAAGDEVNIFRVITDGGTHNRNDASRTLGISLVLQDNVIPNYVVPASTALAPAVTPAGPITVPTNGVMFLKVMYQGRNITAGAKYISSDESKLLVTAGGVLVNVGAGSATVTVSYPGSAVLAPITVTLS